VGLRKLLTRTVLIYFLQLLAGLTCSCNVLRDLKYFLKIKFPIGNIFKKILCQVEIKLRLPQIRQVSPKLGCLAD
jgi:hypothetical protein